MADVDKLIVNRTVSLRDALRHLNDTKQGILLLVNAEGQLIRTVTDGDIRRLLLEGRSLGETLSTLSPQEPKVAQGTLRSFDALHLMNEYGVNQLPVVDQGGCPVSLLHRRDLDSSILLSTPHMGEFEWKFIEDAFSSNWIAPVGPNVDAFERELAQYVGISYATAVNCGTAGLHLALKVIGVQAGDIVFCSTLTFVATANPILYLNAHPVFIDSDLETWNMSPRALGQAFREAEQSDQLPKAVIVVNLYGQSADFDPLLQVCGQYGVPLIEDAAESLGATYKGKASGTLGVLGVYSFNGNKIITTSGGGMLVSENGSFIERAKFLATQARDASAHYQHSEVGYNYRMSNILAGIGRGQLKVLTQRVQARRDVFYRYVEGLSDIPAIQWMSEASFGTSTRWLTAFTLNPELTDVTPRDLIMALAKDNIEARPIWKPMHLQPLFHGCQYYPFDEELDCSGDLFSRGICLPSGSNLNVSQQQRIIYVIRESLAR